MDILFVVEDANLRGGTEILTFNLVHSLNIGGANVRVLSLVPYQGDKSGVISLSDSEYRRWSICRNSFLDKLCFCLFSDFVLRKILRAKIRELCPQLLVNQTYDIITALPTSENVAQVFNWSIKGYEDSLLSSIDKKRGLSKILSLIAFKEISWRRHKVLNRIPHLVILSNVAKKELKELNTEVIDKQISVIPDPLMFSEDCQKTSSLGNRNIVYVGRLSHEKGVMRLLRIWEYISEELPQYTLSIYGEGYAKGEMEEYIRRQKLKNIHFKGFCSNLDDIYSTADLLCMTSETEGFGMVLIEAMYYGVPCVSFDCPVSPKEIIADAGISIPCFDEREYAKQVVALLKNPTAMEDLKEKCKKRAQCFFIEEIAEKWIELKNKVTNN